MKVSNFALACWTIYSSCDSGHQNNQVDKADSKAKNSQTIVVVSDTTIEYNIEGISSEGASAKAKYIGGKIKECDIYIYGETGKNKIVYRFNGEKIDVVEKQFIYNGSLENVKAYNDLKLKKEMAYSLDSNGNAIGRVDADRSDFFNEFEKTVPLKIK